MDAFALGAGDAATSKSPNTRRVPVAGAAAIAAKGGGHVYLDPPRNRGRPDYEPCSGTRVPGAHGAACCQTVHQASLYDR